MRINGKGSITPTATEDDCKRIVASVLAGARVPTTRKQEVLFIMGMRAAMRRYVEADALQPVITTFAHLNPVPRFVVGGYCIDLYFPQQKLAVECDEHGHRHYDVDQEKTRQLSIELQLSCRFHRFDPCEEGFCLYKLMNQLMQLLTTPIPAL